MVNTYGKALPSGNKAAVDKLDQEAPKAAVQASEDGHAAEKWQQCGS